MVSNNGNFGGKKILPVILAYILENSLEVLILFCKLESGFGFIINKFEESKKLYLNVLLIF